MSRRSTTEVSSPMATGPSSVDAASNVTQAMRLAARIAAQRTKPEPVGPRPLQDPHGFLADDAALHRHLGARGEAELLAEGGRQGRLTLRRDGDDVHAETVSSI